MDNFFSSPELFDDLVKKQIYCCGTVRPNRRGMPQDPGPKTTKLKRGDICVRTRADLTAVLWWDKRDICTLTNIRNAAVEGNFCNEWGKSIKPQIVTDYNHLMGYVEKGDRMASSYSINCRTFKWMKKLFCHLLDLAILNSYNLRSSCWGKKISRRFFMYPSEEYVGTCWTRTESTKAISRPPNVESHVTRLEVCGSKHWPILSDMQLRCCIWKVGGVAQKVFVKCRKCEVGQCIKKNMFWRLPHKGTVLISHATSLRKPGDSSQYVSKRNGNFFIFHTIFCPQIKIITAFLNTYRNVSCLISQKIPFNPLFNLVLFPQY